MGSRRKDETLVLLCFLMTVSCVSSMQVMPQRTGSHTLFGIMYYTFMSCLMCHFGTSVKL